MWIYKDKRSFTPAIRAYNGCEYTRGWDAALVSLRDAVKPDQAPAIALQQRRPGDLLS